MDPKRGFRVSLIEAPRLVAVGDSSLFKLGPLGFRKSAEAYVGIIEV